MRDRIMALWRKHPDATCASIARQAGCPTSSFVSQLRKRMIATGELVLGPETAREPETSADDQGQTVDSDDEDEVGRSRSMNLAEKYRPRVLADLVGQSCGRHLRAFVERPYRCCLLFEGPGGVGKTSAAMCVAHALGCVDEMSGLMVQGCSDLGIDQAREVFRTLSLRPFAGRGWRVLVLEELEWLHPQVQRFLKVGLETLLPVKCIVVATSNDVGRLDGPLLQRFSRHEFEGGRLFREMSRERLHAIWKHETGLDVLPPASPSWGDVGGGRFSMRVALNRMSDAVLGLNHKRRIST
jgi:hypothetical protein